MTQKLKTLLSKGFVIALALFLLVTGPTISASAASAVGGGGAGGGGGGGAVAGSSSEAATAVIHLIALILDIFVYAGIVLLVYSLGNLVLSFRSEDSEPKVKAIMTLVVSIALVTIETLLQPLFTAFGVTLP